MTQEERLDLLLDKFKEDSVQYRNLDTGNDYVEKRRFLRALMNIRMPGEMALDVLRIQDEFLRNEAKAKGLVTIEDIPTLREQYHSNHDFANKICALSWLYR